MPDRIVSTRIHIHIGSVLCLLALIHREAERVDVGYAVIIVVGGANWTFAFHREVGSTRIGPHLDGARRQADIGQ